MTPAHERILNVIRTIPPGHVATYGQVARVAGLPGRARLVGRLLNACGGQDIPWHRVINARGTISTRAGGTHDQIECLAREGVQFDEHGRVDLSIYRWAAC